MAADARPIGVLFLCTGNSARSLLAEAALARRGGARFASHSAGSQPKGAPHPRTIETLARLGYQTSGLSSKSWDVFAGDDAPPIDIVVTVCGNAANETCPVWPGAPIRAHWGVEDPAAFEGSEDEERAFFERIHDQLANKVEALVALDFDALTATELADRIHAIADV
ncbi:MAG: arsenate reductase ArsC [bacterium]|nr:arsenate reductase ArsC [bacterium]